MTDRDTIYEPAAQATLEDFLAEADTGMSWSLTPLSLIGFDDEDEDQDEQGSATGEPGEPRDAWRRIRNH